MKSIIEQPPCFFEENLAYQKNTIQSSTYSDQAVVATRWMETAILVGMAGHVHTRVTKNSPGGE